MEEQQQKPNHTLKYKGYLKGHGGWVTTLAVGEEQVGDDKVEFLLSGSRDRTLIKWELDNKKDEDEDREWGRPRRLFTGTSYYHLIFSRPLSLRFPGSPDRRLSLRLFRFMGWHLPPLERRDRPDHEPPRRTLQRRVLRCALPR